jgi:hypothetical protein
MADQYDLVSLTEAKLGLNIPTATTTYDTELALVITAVSQRIVEECGPVVNVTRTNEVYDGGYSDLMLRNAAWSPTVSIGTVSISEYDSTGALTTLSAEDFDTKPADGFIVNTTEGSILRRWSGGVGRFAPGVQNILVTYTIGRAANTAAVPAKFKVAANITINHIWTNLGARSQAARAGDVDGGLAFGIPPFALPKAAIDLLHGERVANLGVG